MIRFSAVLTSIVVLLTLLAWTSSARASGDRELLAYQIAKAEFGDIEKWADVVESVVEIYASVVPAAEVWWEILIDSPFWTKDTKEEYMTEVARLYAQYHTVGELTALLQFYRSSAGEALTEELPNMTIAMFKWAISGGMSMNASSFDNMNIKPCSVASCADGERVMRALLRGTFKGEGATDAQLEQFFSQSDHLYLKAAIELGVPELVDIFSAKDLRAMASFMESSAAQSKIMHKKTVEAEIMTWMTDWAGRIGLWAYMSKASAERGISFPSEEEIRQIVAGGAK